MTREFQVQKYNIGHHRVIDTPPGEDDASLDDDGVRVGISRFAFTANNITYAVVGERMGYWQFFPPRSADAAGWGIIPVWGFAEVIESKNADIAAGERLFGYFPTATQLRLKATRVSQQRFVDGSIHRAGLPAAYNNYTRVDAEPGYDRSTDDARMLLWPLHITSFCLWDALQENSWYGAQQVVIASASSKTSIGLAYALHDDDATPPAIALTSERNLDFVRGLGLYRESLCYGELSDIDAAIPTVIVDMSGNGEMLGRLHAHLGANMKRCINVGLTHWHENTTRDGFIAERSEVFFAPAHIQKRVQDWGAEGFAGRSSEFMRKTALRCRDWLKIRKVGGLDGLADVYDEVCKGRIGADQGLIIELQASAPSAR